MVVAGANRHDMKLTRPTLVSVPVERPKVRRFCPQHLSLDAAYIGDEVAAIAVEFSYTLHVRPRGEEAKEIHTNTRKKARRWVVERTHSWLNRFRRILIRWEKKCDNYLAMLHLAFTLITFGKLFVCF